MREESAEARMGQSLRRAAMRLWAVDWARVWICCWVGLGGRGPEEVIKRFPRSKVGGWALRGDD